MPGHLSRDSWSQLLRDNRQWNSTTRRRTSFPHPEAYNKFRRLQHVRPSLLGWFKMLPSTAIRGFMSTQFEHFRSKKIANVVRTTRWWALRNEFCNENENANSTAAFSCSRSRLGQRKRMLMKTALGHGTKRLEWVMWLYFQLLDAFDLFRNTSVKFSSKLLIELALSVLLDPISIYTTQSRDPKDNRLLIEKLNHSWVQRFMDVHNIVLLSQCGQLSCSPRKEI
jgi:hypothetical protein